MLAVVAVLLAKLVEHPVFAFLATADVALARTLKLFGLIPLSWHFHPHRFGCHFPVRQRILFPSCASLRPVSFILSQLAHRIYFDRMFDTDAAA